MKARFGVVRPPRGRDYDLSYRPNLTVRSRIACNDGTVRQFTPRMIHSQEYSSDQLAQVISAGGSFVSEVQDARVCEVMPIAHVDARDIEFRGMNTECRPNARGGGPPVSDPSWCVEFGRATRPRLREVSSTEQVSATGVQRIGYRMNRPSS